MEAVGVVPLQIVSPVVLIVPAENAGRTVTLIVLAFVFGVGVTLSLAVTIKL